MSTFDLILSVIIKSSSLITYVHTSASAVVVLLIAHSVVTVVENDVACVVVLEVDTVL